MFKKIFSDSLIYALGPQLPKLVGLFLLPIITKFLTADDYAIWGLSMAYSSGLAGLRDLGFTQVLVNFFYGYPGNEKKWKLVWRQLLGVLSVWGFFYGIILAALLYLSLHNKVGANVWMLLFYIVVPAVFFDIITIYGSRFYQFKAKPIPIAINAIIAGTISLVVNYIAVVYLGMHYMSFFIALFASSLFSAIYFFRPVFIQQKLLPIFKIKFRRLKPHLKVGLPTIPHNYSSYLLNASDRVILDIYKLPLSTIGQYNFAYNFGNYAEMLGNALGMAVGPVYIKLYAQRNENAEKQARIFTFILQFIFITASVFVCLWCKEILGILSSNKELASSYPFVILILMSYTYRPMYWAPVSKLGFEEKTQYLWKISFVGGVINVLINVIFLPYFGIYTVVISTFIGLMYIGFSGFYLKVFKEINKQNYYPMLWLSIIVVATSGVFLMKDFSITSKLLISFALLLLLLVIIWWKRSLLAILKEIS